jgi:hypothetical protein
MGIWLRLLKARWMVDAVKLKGRASARLAGLVQRGKLLCRLALEVIQ